MFCLRFICPRLSMIFHETSSFCNSNTDFKLVIRYPQVAYPVDICIPFSNIFTTWSTWCFHEGLVNLCKGFTMFLLKLASIAWHHEADIGWQFWRWLVPYLSGTTVTQSGGGIWKLDNDNGLNFTAAKLNIGILKVEVCSSFNMSYIE